MTTLGSVWATGQNSPRGQLRQGPYIAATAQDTDRVPPAVARLAIDHLTATGDTSERGRSAHRETPHRRLRWQVTGAG